ncbi:hypothetical protein BpHYR1_030210 [Brachionus plicatilis]|uniref:Uncharacterized protein n=1 Tax=Brachionus plicatilis TaxID=10195 RepID=A0A3M7RJL0_BRAPC|nr:hypothetical protein BpHYR1_030210 [Brachionus plicatilis]
MNFTPVYGSIAIIYQFLDESRKAIKLQRCSSYVSRDPAIMEEKLFFDLADPEKDMIRAPNYKP